MPYISNTDDERQEMLKQIGVKTFRELISNIPEKFLHNNDYLLEPGLSEMEVTSKIKNLAKKNTANNDVISFLGGGIYDHFIPAAVQHIVNRPEFLTAYTPYQAEVSQGTLQTHYEYQSMICDMTGMDLSNDGMYDGASAAAEAILMAVRKTKIHKAVIAGTINPLYLQVIKSYTEGVNIELTIIPEKDGLIDLELLKESMIEPTACLLLQTPNFFGNLEEVFEIEKIVHSNKKALFIVAVDPISLFMLNSPSEYNADIVVGEGQSLGNEMNFGGPLYGFFACKKNLQRMLPGRIVGKSIDADNNPVYVLTLQTREQHIRRAKATSNICSNEALCITTSAVYLSLMGKEGMREIAKQSFDKAHYLADEISKIEGFSKAYSASFFKEFAVKTPKPVSEIVSKLEARGIFAGIDLKKFGKENMLLIAVTEKKTKEQLDIFVKNLREVTNA
jgi:glycine dehydrogenase subunit 1